MIGAVCGAAEEGFARGRSPQRRCEGAPPGGRMSFQGTARRCCPKRAAACGSACGRCGASADHSREYEGVNVYAR
jgi:hypothetical protein